MPVFAGCDPPSGRSSSPYWCGPKKRLRGEVLVPRVATADQRKKALERVRDMSPTGTEALELPSMKEMMKPTGILS